MFYIQNEAAYLKVQIMIFSFTTHKTNNYFLYPNPN